MLQRSTAGWTPPLLDVVTVSAAPEPGVVIAELSDTATC